MELPLNAHLKELLSGLTEMVSLSASGDPKEVESINPKLISLLGRTADTLRLANKIAAEDNKRASHLAEMTNMVRGLKNMMKKQQKTINELQAEKEAMSEVPVVSSGVNTSGSLAQPGDENVSQVCEECEMLLLARDEMAAALHAADEEIARLRSAHEQSSSIVSSMRALLTDKEQALADANARARQSRQDELKTARILARTRELLTAQEAFIDSMRRGASFRDKMDEYDDGDDNDDDRSEGNDEDRTGDREHDDDEDGNESDSDMHHRDLQHDEDHVDKDWNSSSTTDEALTRFPARTAHGRPPLVPIPSSLALPPVRDGTTEGAFGALVAAETDARVRRLGEGPRGEEDSAYSVEEEDDDDEQVEDEEEAGAEEKEEKDVRLAKALESRTKGGLPALEWEKQAEADETVAAVVAAAAVGHEDSDEETPEPPSPPVEAMNDSDHRGAGEDENGARDSAAPDVAVSRGKAVAPASEVTPVLEPISSRSSSLAQRMAAQGVDCLDDSFTLIQKYYAAIK